MNGRPIQIELHPHLFNAEAVTDYINALIAKTPAAPPAIIIELYFHDDTALAKLKGINNTAKADLPGVALSIEFNDEYADEFARLRRQSLADPHPPD